MTRSIAMALIPLFVLSCGLVVWASTAHREIPLWGGIVDVAIALTLFAGSFWLHIRVGNARDAFVARAYGLATTLPSMVLVLLWLFRDRVDQNILLPGLAWRLFLALQIFPAAIASRSASPPRS